MGLCLSALLSISLLTARAETPPIEPTRAHTRALAHEQGEEFIFTVYTATAPRAPKAAHATGFVVARSGMIATSYRAVSAADKNPRKYHIYVDLRGKVAEARLVALDLPHDLALISVDHSFRGELSLNTRPPAEAAVIAHWLESSPHPRRPASRR